MQLIVKIGSSLLLDTTEQCNLNLWIKHNERYSGYWITGTLKKHSHSKQYWQFSKPETSYLNYEFYNYFSHHYHYQLIKSWNALSAHSYDMITYMYYKNHPTEKWGNLSVQWLFQFLLLTQTHFWYCSQLVMKPIPSWLLKANSKFKLKRINVLIWKKNYF